MFVFKIVLDENHSAFDVIRRMIDIDTKNRIQLTEILDILTPSRSSTSCTIRIFYSITTIKSIIINDFSWTVVPIAA